MVSKSNLEDKIKQLIDVSTALLKWSRKFYDIYIKNKPNEIVEITDYINHPKIKLLALFSNLYFFDSLLNLNSLLFPSKKEISFFEYQKLIFDNSVKKKLNKKLEEIKIKAKDYKLDKIRKQILAHKNIDSSGDPNVGYLNFMSPILFGYIEEILDDLNNITLEFFDVPVNNSFEIYYLKAHNILFNFLKI